MKFLEELDKALMLLPLGNRHKLSQVTAHSRRRFEDSDRFCFMSAVCQILHTLRLILSDRVVFFAKLLTMK